MSPMVKTIFTKEHKLIVERLKKARLESNLSQKQAAILLKTTQSNISKTESGQRRIDMVQAKAYAKLYKKSFNYFLR
jgi:transcriptional regulator with XRE-family HTH domain